MKSIKSELLNHLKKAFHLAHLSNQYQIPTDELTELINFQPKTTRRDFIRNTTMASAGTLLFPDSFLQKNQKKIAIIGGGMAGLAAGYHLKKAGFNFTIYEATRRTGGRILSVKDGVTKGVTTEFGGEFLDSNHEEMLKYARDFGFEFIDTAAKSEASLIKNLYIFDNKRYSDKDVVNEFKHFAPKIVADANKLPETIDYLHPDTSGFDKVSIDEYFEKIGVKGWAAEMIKVAYTGEYGLETGLQSALNLILLITPGLEHIKPKTKRLPKSVELFGISDERYKVFGGNQQIPNKLADSIQNHIKTDHELIAVSELSNGQFKLKFENRPEIIADIVIMTLPFTILRNIDLKNIKMEPWKKRSIMELSYGTNSKLMMGFKKRVWREQNHAGYLYTPEIHTGWDSSIMQNNNQGEGSYSVFLGGKAGFNLKQTDQNKYIGLIDNAFAGMKENYNGQRKLMNWATNPYSKGSYTCYTVGQWSSIGLAESLPVRSMFFAGEHCDVEFQGFMNGAAKSGREVAEKIAAMLK